MNKKLKFFIITITGITSFSLLLIFNFYIISPAITPKENVSDITLIVDYKNGTIKTHEDFTLVNGSTTVFDALNKWCDVAYIENINWGVFVTEIDGISGDWIYSVNNFFPNVGASKYPLSDGDEVKWMIK